MYNVVRSLTNEEFQVDEKLIDYRLELTKQPGAMEAYRATFEWFAKEADLLQFTEEQLKTIKQNVLLVHGRNDRMVPIENSFELFNALENSYIYAMSHCGHWAMLEYPEEFTNICVEFIRQH